MFEKYTYNQDKTLAYQELCLHVTSIIEKELPVVTNLANLTALLNCFFKDINWVGFYLYDQKQLVLGPFQGLPACTTIQLNKGVCGTSAQTLTTQLVADVHQFPGHIACDGASKSEIVIPILYQNQLLGVLDIDSPLYNRFDEIDQIHLEKIVDLVVCKLQTSKWL